MPNKNEDMIAELNADAIDAIFGAGELSVSCSWRASWLRCNVKW